MTLNGRFVVFQDLTLDVPEGSNVGLIGRNGAGKSTLMRLLSGVEPPDSGQIITRGRLSWPVGLKTGMQNNLTGRENVKFVCRLQGIRGSGMKEIIEYVRDFADIGEYFDRPVSNYSSGMRARIAFGTSMAFDFDYYLIDEAMAVGDAVFKRKSRAIFKDRLQKSKVVLVSHNMKLIRRMCNVVVHLDRGHATVYEDINKGIAQYRQAGGEP
jgi:capsular polysaccharide transport system ATP-binding protein